jgi:transposase InsO family protein
MGIEALYRRANTSRRHPCHLIYPYLLRKLVIDRPNQVWATDVTYIPMARGFVYLVAVMDWFSRKVLSWRISNSMTADFCVEALEEAIAKYGAPEIFNADQGSQFTASSFIQVLQKNRIQISMDGRGAWRDNVFVERLWKSARRMPADQSYVPPIATGRCQGLRPSCTRSITRCIRARGKSSLSFDARAKVIGAFIVECHSLVLTNDLARN